MYKFHNNNAQNSLPITLSIFSTHDSFKLQGKTKIQYKQGISFLQVDISYSDIPLYIRTQEINALELKEISGTLDGTFHLSKESPFSYNIQNQNILHISSVVPIPKLENGTKISKELMDKKDFSFDTHILIENNTTTLSQTENSISKNSTIVDATTQILTHNIALIFQNLKDPVSILVENYAHTILTDTSEKLSSMQKKLNIQKPKANKLYDDLVTLMEYSNKKTSSIIKDNINAHTKNIGNQIRQKIRNAIATP